MPTLKELGRLGAKRYNGVFYEEFLQELRGAKGAEVYTEMADNDSTIGAILFAIENLMRNCEFTIEPAGNTAKDKEAAEFVQGCMDDMCVTWTDTLSEILSFITYGWSYHEIVYKRRMGKRPGPDSSKYDDGLIGWKKLPIRSQESLYEWKYKEHTDDLTGMEQWTVTDCDIIQAVIPIEKALHFVTRSRKQNPEGRSILRTAYRDWYFKKRIEEIEGIGIERDLAGFPTLTAPEGLDLWDGEDPEMVAALANAERIVTGIRRDSREGLVMPFGWELQLLSTGSRRQFDTNQIIERYNKQIATSVLTDFVLLGHESVGSFALADNKTKMFALAVGTYLDIICEVFNSQGIPRLIDINGEHFKGITDYPYMKHGDIEDANLEKIGAFIQQMVGSGALTPDDELEDYIRQISNLPERKTSIPYEERKGEVSPGDNKDGMHGAEPSEETKREQAKEKKKQQDIDDKQDEKEAEEAKKSLGRYDAIEKFNPYHDNLGRFATGDGASSFSASRWQMTSYDDKKRAFDERKAGATSASSEKAKKPKQKEVKKPNEKQRKQSSTGDRTTETNTKEVYNNTNMQVMHMDTKGFMNGSKKAPGADSKLANYLKMYSNGKVDVTEQEAGEMFDSVKHFTNNGYQSVRKYQSTGKGGAKAKKDAENIEKYIQIAPKWAGGTLYRSIGLSSDQVRKLKPGTNIDMQGTSSWTSSKSVSDSYAYKSMDRGTAVTFQLAKTTKGCSINHMSHYDGENEVLISNTARFKISNVTKDNRGRTIVEVEEY